MSAATRELVELVEAWAAAGGARLGGPLACSGPEWSAVGEFLRRDRTASERREVLSLAASLVRVVPALSVVLREVLGDGPLLRSWEVGVVELEARAWASWVAVYVPGGAP